MTGVKPTMAEEVAAAAEAFQRRLTGHAPREVSVSLAGDTLVITLHGALTPAEQAVSESKVGAAQVQEFHRRLFETSSGLLRQEIKRITGVEVRDAAIEAVPPDGMAMHAFKSGTVVIVLQLAAKLPATDSPPGDARSIPRPP